MTKIVALILAVTKAGTQLAIAFAALMLVGAGIMLMRGSDQHRSRAKDWIPYIFGGLAIAIMASALVTWFQTMVS